MSRNGSGTYTLPSGNPVVTGTLIEATWANTTLSDLASAMTDSLSRSAQGGMTAALRLFDGTSSVPGLAWGSETTTGWYRAGAGDMRLVVTGSEVIKYLSSGVSVTGTLSATGATTFSGQTNTFENSTAYYPQLINRNKTNDANGSYFVLEKVRNTSVVQNGDVLGNLIYRGYDGTQYLQGAYINAIVSATPGTNDMPTDLSFGTTPDGGAGPSERMRITQAGNVGIGTSSPNGRFQVTGGTTNASNLATAYSAAAFTLVPKSTSGFSLAFGSGPSDFPYIQMSAAGSVASDMTLQPYGGNVGIGTSLPGYKLDVSATSFIAASVSTSYSGAGNIRIADASTTSASAPYVGSVGNNLTFGRLGTAEYVRIDSSGNLGIGTSSPTAGGKLDVNGIAYFGTGDKVKIYSNNVLQTAGTLDVGTIGSAALILNTANTERARIDSSGNLLVGTTTVVGTGKISLNFGASGDGIAIISSGTSDRSPLTFYNGNGFVGRVSTSGSSTAYLTSSDYRLKENIQPMAGALAKVTALKPVTYKWKIDGADGQGFIAHELQEVVPECVTGEKDATRIEQYEISPAVPATYDEEGNELTPAVEAVMGEREVPVYQGIDTSFLVATLTAAIQELKAIVDAQAARIEALETAA